MMMMDNDGAGDSKQQTEKPSLIIIGELFFFGGRMPTMGIATDPTITMGLVCSHLFLHMVKLSQHQLQGGRSIDWVLPVDKLLLCFKMNH